MVDQNDLVEIRVTVKDEASADLKKIQAALDQLGAGLNLSGTSGPLGQLAASTERLGAAVRGLDPAPFEKMVTSLERLAALQSPLAAVSSEVGRLGSAGGSFGALAAEIDKLQTSLDRLRSSGAGSSSGAGGVGASAAVLGGAASGLAGAPEALARGQEQALRGMMASQEQLVRASISLQQQLVRSTQGTLRQAWAEEMEEEDRAVQQQQSLLERAKSLLERAKRQLAGARVQGGYIPGAGPLVAPPLGMEEASPAMRAAGAAAEDAADAIGGVTSALRASGAAGEQAGAQIAAGMRKAKEAVPGQGGFTSLPWAPKKGEKNAFPGGGMLESSLDMAKTFFVWTTLYGLYSQATGALSGLVSGLVTTNTTYQSLGATLSAIYGSDGAGKAALDWADQLAEKLPQTRQEVRGAALTLASAGVNLGTGLPSIANLASAMHPEGGIQAAAQAVVDAQAGRTEMLRVTLRTQVEPLRDFGLEIEKSGHIVSSTFVPALERYVAVRFGEHVAADTATLAAFGQQTGLSAQQVNQTKELTARQVASFSPLQQAQLEVMHAGMVVAGDRPQSAQQPLLAGLSGALASPRTAQSLAALHTAFGITAADLDKVSTGWRSSDAAATAALAHVLEGSYGGHAALLLLDQQLSATEKQFQTLAGAASNVLDVVQDLQRRAGQGLVASMQKELTGSDPHQIGGIVGAIGDPQRIGGALAAVATTMGQGLGDTLDAIFSKINAGFGQMGGFSGVLLALTNAWKEFTSAAQTAWGILQGVAGGLKVVWDALSALWGVWAPILSGLAQFAGGNQVVVGVLTALVVGVRLAGAAIGATSATIATATGIWGRFAATVGLSTEALTANAGAQTAAGAAGGLAAGAGGAAALARPVSALAGLVADVPVLGGVMAGLTSQFSLATLGVGAFLADFYLVPKAFEDLTTYIQNLGGRDIAGANAPLRAALEPSTQTPTGHWTTVWAAPPDSLAPADSPPGADASVYAPTRQRVWVGSGQSPQDQFESFLQKQPPGTMQMGGAGWAYNRMINRDNPSFFAEWLAQHPDDKITQKLLSVLPATSTDGSASQQSVKAIMAARFPGLAATAFTQYNAAMQQVALDTSGSAFLRQNLPGDLALATEARYGRDKAMGMTPDQIYGSRAPGGIGPPQPSDVDTFYNRLATAHGLPTLQPPTLGARPLESTDQFSLEMQARQGSLAATLSKDQSPAQMQEAYRQIRTQAYRGQSEGYLTGDQLFDTLNKALGQIAQHLGQVLQWKESLGEPFTALFGSLKDSAQNAVQTVQLRTGQHKTLGDEQDAKLAKDLVGAFTPDMTAGAMTAATKKYADYLRQSGLKQPEIDAIIGPAERDAAGRLASELQASLPVLGAIGAPLGQQEDVIQGAYQQTLKTKGTDPLVAGYSAQSQTLSLWQQNVSQILNEPVDQAWASLQGLRGQLKTEGMPDDKITQALSAMGPAWQAYVQAKTGQIQGGLSADLALHAPLGTLLSDLASDDQIRAQNTSLTPKQRAAAHVGEQDQIYGQQMAQDQDTLRVAAMSGAGWGQIATIITKMTSDAQNAHQTQAQILLADTDAIKAAGQAMVQSIEQQGGSEAQALAAVGGERAQLMKIPGMTPQMADRIVSADRRSVLETYRPQVTTGLQTQYQTGLESGQITTPQQIGAWTARLDRALANQPGPVGEQPWERTARLQAAHLGYGRQGYTSLIGQDDARFQYDAGAANPNLRVMRRDSQTEIAHYAAELHAHLITQDQYNQDVRRVNQRLENAFPIAQQGVTPPAQYGREGAFSQATQYGGAQVRLGGIAARTDGSAEIIRHLQEMIRSLQEQLKHAREQSPHIQQTATNTGKIAQNTEPVGHTQGHEARYPSPQSRMRSGGGHVFPVRA